MSHSVLSAPMNLGLLDPLDVVRQAEEVYRSDGARLASVEGFVRQVMGWRDYVWHLYWHLGDDYRAQRAARAPQPAGLVRRARRRPRRRPAASRAPSTTSTGTAGSTTSRG